MKSLKKFNYLFIFSVILFLFFSCNNTTDNEVIDVIDDHIGIDLDIPPFDFNRLTGIYALGPAHNNHFHQEEMVLLTNLMLTAMLFSYSLVRVGNSRRYL